VVEKMGECEVKKDKTNEDEEEQEALLMVE
jgi:hypothetical protein